MIVCHCSVVSDREVTAAVDNGARSLGDLCRETGAGAGCGGCTFSLRALLSRHQRVSDAAITEVAGAAS
jgi:bacterioferritin-associated ferredoxin